jgi:hypothetical protein
MTCSTWIARFAKYTVSLATLGLVAIFAWCIFRALTFKNTGSLSLDGSQQRWPSIVVSLTIVAAIVERATEVIVMVFRDRGAEELQERADTAPDAKASADPDAKTNKEVLGAYQAATKEFALPVAFSFGLLAALAGVRALHPLLADPHAATGRLFAVLDIIITGAMLAGGSEGVHRIANVVTSGADTLSTKFDNAATK